MVAAVSPGISVGRWRTLRRQAHRSGKVAGFLGAMGQAIITALAIVSLFVLIYAIGLYLTGRGLAAGQAWGRILGIVLTVIPFSCRWWWC